MSDSKRFVGKVSDRALVKDSFVMESTGASDEEGSSMVCNQSMLYKKKLREVLQRQVNMIQEGA